MVFTNKLRFIEPRHRSRKYAYVGFDIIKSGRIVDLNRPGHKTKLGVIFRLCPGQEDVHRRSQDSPGELNMLDY